MDESGEFEKLFRFGGGYVYVQYLCDNLEYDFDYTIYDDDFNDIDGGVTGTGGILPDLISAARDATGIGDLTPVDLTAYRERYDFL